MTLSEDMVREVLAVMDQYVGFYNAKNLTGVGSLISKTISGFGTGKDEIVADCRQFKEAVCRDFVVPGGILLATRMLVVDGIMPVAWCTGLCEFHTVINGRKTLIESRMTVVLSNTGSRWVIEQIHFSLPDMVNFSGSE